MIRVFLALAISYFILAIVAFAIGMWVHDSDSFGMHFVIGVLTTLFTCFVYCLVLTYFVITGKVVKQAVENGSLPTEHITRSQKRKGRYVALSMWGVAMALLAALLGALGTTVEYGQATPLKMAHMIAQCISVAGNGLLFYWIFGIIAENAGHLDKVLELYDQGRASKGMSSHAGRVP